MKPHIAILTAIHGRHAIAERMVRRLSALRSAVESELKVSIFAVVSEEEPVLDFLADCGVVVVRAANKPVSRKWQVGLAGVQATQDAPDAVMILGSDDFLSEEYLRHCGALAASGVVQAWGPDRVWVFDSIDKRMGVWIGPVHMVEGRSTPAGAGRLFTRPLLDLVGWTLWPFDKNSGLDIGCARHLDENYGVVIKMIEMQQVPGAVVLDWKDAENIHCFSQFRFQWPEMLPLDEMNAALVAVGLDSVLEEEAWVCPAPTP